MSFECQNVRRQGKTTLTWRRASSAGTVVDPVHPHASKAHAFQRAVGTTPVKVPDAVPVQTKELL